MFGIFRVDNFFYADYASLNVVFKKTDWDKGQWNGYEFRMEINNQFRDTSLNQLFVSNDKVVKRCPQVNKPSYFRLYSVNSEKNKDTKPDDQFPLYNFNEQSDWLFYDVNNDSNNRFSASFNLKFVKDTFNLNRPLTYNILNNPSLVPKDIDFKRFISKSNKDLANEVVLLAKNYFKPRQCTFDVL